MTAVPGRPAHRRGTGPTADALGPHDQEGPR